MPIFAVITLTKSFLNLMEPGLRCREGRAKCVTDKIMALSTWGKIIICNDRGFAPMDLLETKRLILRELRQSDAERIFTYANDTAIVPK